MKCLKLLSINMIYHNVDLVLIKRQFQDATSIRDLFVLKIHIKKGSNSCPQAGYA